MNKDIQNKIKHLQREIKRNKSFREQAMLKWALERAKNEAKKEKVASREQENV